MNDRAGLHLSPIVINLQSLNEFVPKYCYRGMHYTQSDILKALSTVEDPDLRRDLVSLNMIKDVRVENGKCSFTVVLTTPA